ncbi:hypothetical protein [Myxococcus sp. AB025B]|uniref:hypothetical protein n=1 Tax=Myxococcus TaxID=32 RepID=UPI001143C7CD|nr:hypothetical protein [Myxococcus sp. AB025B]
MMRGEALGCFAAVSMAVALVGCSHGGQREEKKGDTRCEESRNLSCITGTECSMDRDRGCEVCRCAPPTPMTPTDKRRPTAMEPERRW